MLSQKWQIPGYSKSGIRLRPFCCTPFSREYCKVSQCSQITQIHFNFSFPTVNALRQLIEKIRPPPKKVALVFGNARDGMENFPEVSNDYVKGLFHPMLPDFRNSTALWKVPRLRQFVLLLRSRWRWSWLLVEW